MDYKKLRLIYLEFLRGERNDLSPIEADFPYEWCLVDGDGYHLSMLYGKGFYAIV